MKIIRKYRIVDCCNTRREVTLEIPFGFIPRHMVMQNGFISIWAEIIDSNAKNIVRQIYIAGTGEKVPTDTTYIGTVDENGLMRHLYIKDQQG